jgi:exodeoxyribonuclease V alpha subunit
MLQRNLLYTAITRAKQLLVLVGMRKALAIATKNDATRRRYSRLRERLTIPAEQASSTLSLTPRELPG